MLNVLLDQVQDKRTMEPLECKLSLSSETHKEQGMVVFGNKSNTLERIEYAMKFKCREQDIGDDKEHLRNKVCNSSTGISCVTGTIYGSVKGLSG